MIRHPTALELIDAVARFIREKKPGVQMTLENTKPDNAVQARKFVEGLLTE